jgi:rubredoxin
LRPLFEGSAKDAGPDDALECGVCWWVYDPKEGDEWAGIPPGVPFATLPDDWVCPQCEAPASKFMRLVD